MKLFKSSIALLLACALLLIYVPAVSAAAVTFADPNFEAAVRSQLNIPTGPIDSATLAGVTKLDFSGIQINNFSDLQYFTGLTWLDVSNHLASALDVTKNTVLSYLNCRDNQLTTLDVSKNMALTYLDCSVNQLTALDISKNTALTYLNCDFNQLTSLDISNNLALTSLIYTGNPLRSTVVMPTPILRADVIGDGYVDFADYRSLLADISGIIGPGQLATNGDVNGDGQKTAYDAFLISQYLNSKQIDDLARVGGGESAAAAAFTVGSASVIPGKTVTVPVMVTSSAIAACTLEIQYDWDSLRLVSYKSGGDPGGSTSSINYSNDPIKISYIAINDYFSDPSPAGTVVYLTFQMLGNIIVPTDLTLTVDDCVDSAGNNIQVTAQSGVITPTSTITFADPTFEAAVRHFLGIPTGPVTTDVTYAVTDLDLSDCGISDFSDLQYFPNVQYLDVSGNNATTLDVTNMSILLSLNCSNNGLLNLTINYNSHLYLLDCSNNRLGDVNYPFSLAYLDASNNMIWDLQFYGTTNFVYLNLLNNPIYEPEQVIESSAYLGINLLLLTINGQNHTYADLGGGVTGELVTDSGHYAVCSPDPDDDSGTRILITVVGTAGNLSFSNATGAENFTRVDADTYTADLTADTFYAEINSVLFQPGDVSQDGKINTVDARLILQSIVNKTVLTDDQKLLADVNGDNKIDTVDARLVLQYIVGKINTL